MDTTLPEHIHGLIFDYGGTLDTGGDHWGKVIWHAYNRCGVPVGEQLFREAYVYGERTLGRQPIVKPDFTFRDTLKAKLHLQLEHIDIQTHGEAFKRQSRAQTLDSLLDDLYGGVCERTKESAATLAELHRQYPMALVSNFYGNISTVLREFRLDGLFSHIIESAVVGIRKPDPRIFTLGVVALGLDPANVAVVGDSYEKDIAPAHEAGCATVWMKGEPWQAYPPATPAADRTITRLSELLGQ